MTDNNSSEWLFPYGSDQRYTCTTRIFLPLILKQPLLFMRPGLMPRSFGTAALEVPATFL